MTNDSVHIIALGTANPPIKFRQEEICRFYPSAHPIMIRFVKSSQIQTRHLWLRPNDIDGELPLETQSALLNRHKNASSHIGGAAINEALAAAKLGPAAVDYLCCVTSTGFMSPGLSAMFIRTLGFQHSCQRIDLVGMGCNGGLNGLNAVSCWAKANPGKYAMLVCCEVNSAIYATDSSIETWVVNSIFGDGAAAVLLRAGHDDERTSMLPTVLAFESHIVPEHWEAMRFDWSDVQGRWRFRVSEDVARVLGANIDIPVDLLLSRRSIPRTAVAHWIIHAGGPKIVASVKAKLGLTESDLRHTVSVLRDFGNVSSASFLFTLQSLLRENSAKSGDFGVLIAMGPGTTIETALVQW